MSSHLSLSHLPAHDWLSVAVCLLATTHLLAAPSFRADRNYPNLGLRCRVLAHSEPEPIAQFKTYSYTFTRQRVEPVGLRLSPQNTRPHRHHIPLVLVLRHRATGRPNTTACDAAHL